MSSWPHYITLQVFLSFHRGRKDLAYRHSKPWHVALQSLRQILVQYRKFWVMPLFWFLHQTSREWRWQWKLS